MADRTQEEIRRVTDVAAMVMAILATLSWFLLVYLNLTCLICCDFWR